MLKDNSNDQLSGYELSRNWFDWCYENPEKISPAHTAMYFFIVDHWNRLGQKDKFGLPSEMTKDAIGIKNYRTYSNVFNDLIEWGFIKVIQKSKNQYSSNIIAIAKNTKAHTKALTKATLKHSQKQSKKQVDSNCKSIVGIDKPITKEQINNNTPLPPSGEMSDFKIIEDCPEREKRDRFKIPLIEEIKAYCLERKNNISPERFFDHYQANGWMIGKSKMKDWKASVRTWEKNSDQKPIQEVKVDRRVHYV
jgi:hypothetical protein